MHTPDVIQQILSEIANWNLKNVKFCGMDEGALPPMTPVNPYLGGNAWKKWATFYLSVHLCTLWKPHFGAKYGPRGPPRAIYEPGGPGCRRDTYRIERVKWVLVNIGIKGVTLVMWSCVYISLTQISRQPLAARVHTFMCFTWLGWHVKHVEMRDARKVRFSSPTALSHVFF